MKTCPTCNRLVPEDGGFCPIDGQKLLSTDDVTPPSDPEDRRVGTVVCGGRYQIWRRVADGGMGRVYQALDHQLGRSVALKVLHPEVADDIVAVERFKREFECSASLPHDYIVEVIDFNKTEDGSYALVMEYLEGEELRTLLKREKVTAPAQLVRMLSHVAIGLQAAHDRSVVHRDMKPDNIFICGTHDGGLSKILDFGSVRDNSIGAKKLTMIGTTIGSPFYMSPEQAQALPDLDHRADVWSLAAIAYECLTGKLPFFAATGPAILLAILTADPVPLSEAGKEKNLPATLDPVIEEALAKSPGKRTPTVGALVDQIGRALGLEGSHAQWAVMPEADLAAQIEVGLPSAIARHEADAHRDQRFAAMEDAFKAGSDGGPGPGAFAEDMIMGVPLGTPTWVYAAAAAAVFLGVVIAFLAFCR